MGFRITGASMEGFRREIVGIISAFELGVRRGAVPRCPNRVMRTL